MLDADVEGLFDRLDRFMGWPWRRTPLETRGWGPLVEMVDQKDKLLVKAELPGVKKEDIRVSVTGDVLTIEGERESDEEVKQEDYYC